MLHGLPVCPAALNVLTFQYCTFSSFTSTSVFYLLNLSSVASQLQMWSWNPLTIPYLSWELNKLMYVKTLISACQMEGVLPLVAVIAYEFCICTPALKCPCWALILSCCLLYRVLPGCALNRKNSHLLPYHVQSQAFRRLEQPPALASFYFNWKSVFLSINRKSVCSKASRFSYMGFRNSRLSPDECQG